MTPEIWVIVPTCRPGNVNRIISNFTRQRYQRKRLVVVENGEAVGSWSRFRHPVDVVLQSKNHPGSARNVALDYLLERHPDAYSVNMDDDDIYGEHYLDEHAAVSKPGTVWTNRPGWIQFDDCLVWFGNNHEAGGVVKHNGMGSSIGCHVAGAGRYSESECAEEYQFLEGCRENGSVVRALSGRHYVCMRTNGPQNHTWQADQQKVWRISGHGVKIDADPYEVLGSRAYGPGGFWRNPR